MSDAFDDYRNLIEDRDQLRVHNEQLRADLSESRRLLDDARAQKPVAYMHNKRADVIHTSVKSLLSDFAVNSGPESMLRPIDKSEHYTIPLYAAPVPAQPAAVPEAVAKDAARYRFLKERSPFGNRVPHIDQYPYQPKIDRSEFPHFTVVGLDEAIDAAILSAANTEVKK